MSSRFGFQADIVQSLALNAASIIKACLNERNSVKGSTLLPLCGIRDLHRLSSSTTTEMEKGKRGCSEWNICNPTLSLVLVEASFTLPQSTEFSHVKLPGWPTRAEWCLLLCGLRLGCHSACRRLETAANCFPKPQPARDSSSPPLDGQYPVTGNQPDGASRSSLGENHGSTRHSVAVAAHAACCHH